MIDSLLSFIEVQGYLILALPVVGAFVGWLTNAVAVKMLFHPRKPWGPLKVQGVFPKRQAALAKKVGELVSRELLSSEVFTEKLLEKARSKKVSDLIAVRIEEFLTKKLPIVMPMVSFVLTPELVTKVVSLFVGDLENVIERVVQELKTDIEQELDVQVMVETKVREFSSEKLEQLLHEVMKREFRFIELIGGVLGFLIGCFQLAFLIVSKSLS